MHRLAEPVHPSSIRLGAILAGGRSRRFGSPKQLATIGGVALLDRVAAALRGAGARAVLVGAAELPYPSHPLASRYDLRPGQGPLSGLHTALVWARELGLPGALCVACDLPFASSSLLRRLAEIGEAEPDTVVAPQSPGAHPVEPLCAWYPASAAREVEHRLDSGARSLQDLLEALPCRVLPLSEVRRFGDPETIFLNVNTPADGERAAVVHAREEAANGLP